MHKYIYILQNSNGRGIGKCFNFLLKLQKNLKFTDKNYKSNNHTQINITEQQQIGFKTIIIFTIRETEFK